MMPAEIESAYPLSPFQEGLLFHVLKAPASHAYLGQEAYRLDGPLNTAHLEEAWRRVTQRHPALRTAVVWEGVERMLQVVFHRASPPWRRSDSSDLSQESYEDKLASLMQDERAIGIDVSKAPMLRLHLARVSPVLHFLVITQHHLVMDGWSYGLALKEVMAHYHALNAGTNLELPAAPPFRDYIDWLADCETWRAEEFWRAKLSGVRSSTPLPFMRPSAVSNDYDIVRWKLTEAEAQRLTAFTRESQLTVNTVVQGAWALLLSQFAGADVVFGTPMTVRPPTLPGSEAMVGPLMNTVPVRVQLSSDAPLVTFLSALQQEQSKLQDYAFASLVQIQGWSEMDPRESLFDSLVVVENYPTNVFEQLHGSGWTNDDVLSISPVEGFARTHYPLTLHVLGKSQLVFEFVYDSGGFTREAIELLISRFRALWTRILEDGRSPISELARMSAADKAEILRYSTGEHASRGAAASDSIVEKISAYARRTPNAVAVESSALVLTYRELDEKAAQLARVLLNAGVGPEVLVAVYLPRDWQAIVGVLAVLRTGAAFVPVDGDGVRERLTSIITDCGCSIVLTNAELAGGLPAGSFLPVFLDEAFADTDSSSSEPLVPTPVDADNLAYVIYTSGSTGKPKGVAVTHRGLANYLGWAVEAYRADQGSGAPLHSPLVFDLTLTSLFLPLATGKRIFVAPLNDLEQTARSIFSGRDFTFVKLTPSHLRAFTELAAGMLPDTAVRACVVGGEQLLFDDLRAWRRTERPRIFNEYGPTETVVGCTMYSIAQSDPQCGPVPIGRPIENTFAFVVDDNGELAPLGATGELHIGGAAVARGYLNDPALTADKFVPDPHSGVPGSRLYRSGDQVRWLPGWQLEYVGRRDNQVKIRGRRVELGEIEAVLASHPDVRSCCVTAVREESRRDLRLAAYVVSRSRQLNPEDLRRWAEKRLPDHMRPEALAMLPELPLSPGGKVDRKALPSADWNGNRQPTAPEDPVTTTEMELAAIWQQLLDRETIGRNDNFFRIGGNSLVATQLISRVQSKFHVSVPLRLVFDAPTIREFADELDRLPKESSGIAVDSVQMDALPTILDDLSEEEIEQYLASLNVET